MLSAPVEGLLRNLPVRPFAATAVMRMVDDPDSSLSDLADVVRFDPALSARILRMARSLPGQSSDQSIERAVTMLGSATVQALVASAAFPLLDPDPDMGPPGFWAHAVSVAAGAAAVATRLRLPAGETYTAGLLHDIGSVVFHYADAETFATARSASSADLLSRERASFGFDHPEAGGRAAEAWGLPESIVLAIRGHHDSPGTMSPTARCVAIAETMVGAADDAWSEPSSTFEGLIERFGYKLDRPLLVRDIEARLGGLDAFTGADS